ncbi:MAG: holo-ACP synthase [Promethearchaeota archaeon]
MTNWSIGIDIIEIQRFRMFLPSKHSRFYERVFSEYEFQYCIDFSDPYPHFAGIFAAKEAIFKALNKLLPIKLTQISIRHDKNGRPIVSSRDDLLSLPTANKWLNNNHNLEVQVSIAHTNELAIAWAVAFSRVSDFELLENLSEVIVEFKQGVYDELLKYRCIS